MAAFASSSQHSRRRHTRRHKDGGSSSRQREAQVKKWRVHDVPVEIAAEEGKGREALLEAVSRRLGLQGCFPSGAMSIARRSVDSRRGQVKLKYVVDVSIDKIDGSEERKRIARRLESKSRQTSHIVEPAPSLPAISLLQERGGGSISSPSKKSQRVIVVGAGPAGLMASLVLIQRGINVTLVERGESVERRGRDIGRLATKRLLNPESNFCFGEGGAGTWSDGKLTTRIGRNSEHVRGFMNLLVELGAPNKIRTDGKPHLGTEKMIAILRNLRKILLDLGVVIRFGSCVRDLCVDGDLCVNGVKLSESSQFPKGEVLVADAVVFAIGHSSRDAYRMLKKRGVALSMKNFAAGFRMEHPQALINEIMYGENAGDVKRGKGRLPVADYSYAYTSTTSDDDSRGVYSFCMCPGGQIVLSSTEPELLCVNGMSFSSRGSKWANSALVTQISKNDFLYYERDHGVLAGVAWQEFYERKAALMGGEPLRVPVQTIPDFLEGTCSGEIPSSSYRLGVKESRLDLLYPKNLTESIREALLNIEKKLPGAISHQGLLHGVETRTSSPVRIERDKQSYMSTSHKGLYPAGEGGGFAGGIVSAAMDGFQVGTAVAANLMGIPAERIDVKVKQSY